MRTPLTILLAAMTCISASAFKYIYAFNDTPISEAVVRISKDNPDVSISFIYKELDNYKTSARIHTDDIYEALRKTIGLNPISIIKKGQDYYIEALQRGRFVYTGLAVDKDNEPVTGASVTLLAPRDSAVITYGITDSDGRFAIPCDKKKVLAKFTCIGYRTTYVDMPGLDMGTILMQQSPIQLSAVSVEAESMFLSTDKNVYIPTSGQKNASQNVADLLRRMAIPQLLINPADNSVKDVFGNRVAVFINYHEAQPDELKGMKMTDVRRIEYIELPSDPRFKGEERVVNFIVQEYEYGGYTKMSESFTTLNGLFNNTDVFSRFTYKKMTYDFYAGSDNQNFHHAGTDNSAVYRLDDNAVPLNLARKETFIKSHTQTDEYPLTFRASYYSPRFSARNTLSFTHHSTPRQFSCGNLSVSTRPGNNYTYSRNTPDRNNTIYYNSNFWGAVGSNVSFDITPSFRHTHRDNTSAYESTLLDEPIFNHITENSYNWEVEANGRMGIGPKSQLSMTVSGGQIINKLEYRGSNNIDDSYHISYVGGRLQYRFQTKKFSVSTFLGYIFEHNSMNGITTNQADPRIGVSLWFSLSPKSQISGYLSFLSTTPDIGMKANDIVQSNEFMYLTANPALKNWRNLTSNLSYNYYYNNSFSLSAFAGYEKDFDRVAVVYRPYNNGMALLRDYTNNGSFIRYYLGVSANYKLFNNSLQLYANLAQNVYEITGDYRDSCYPFRIQLQGAYYWKNFNIVAAWANPERTLTGNSSYVIRRRNFHVFSFGWGNGTWTVNLSAKNIFNKGWHSATWHKRSPLYDECLQEYRPYAHASINLSATYTIGYGRKVRRNNEVGGQGSAPSSIIR